MNAQKPKPIFQNSKGAAIFKKMLDDKKAVHTHLQSGGSLADLKDAYPFVTPISLKEE